VALAPDTDGEPSPKFHENVYGVVPPVAVELTLIEVPTVPVEGTMGVTVRVNGDIMTIADFVWVAGAVAESVPVTLIVYDPFTLYVVLKPVPVPVAGVPPVAVQLKLKGAVPPVAEAVQLTIAPTIPVAGQDMVTVKTGAEPIV